MTVSGLQVQILTDRGSSAVETAAEARRIHDHIPK